jgi:hypothetical protein
MLRGRARAEAAQRIRALAAEGRTDPQIGRDLNLSATVVQQILAEKGIEAGSKQSARRRSAKCPICKVLDLQLAPDGVMAPHKWLGQRKGLLALAVPCPGSGLKPENEGDAL